MSKEVKVPKFLISDCNVFLESRPGIAMTRTEIMNTYNAVADAYTALLADNEKLTALAAHKTQALLDEQFKVHDLTEENEKLRAERGKVVAEGLASLDDEGRPLVHSWGQGHGFYKVYTKQPEDSLFWCATCDRPIDSLVVLEFRSLGLTRLTFFCHGQDNVVTEAQIELALFMRPVPVFEPPALLDCRP